MNLTPHIKNAAEARKCMKKRLILICTRINYDPGIKKTINMFNKQRVTDRSQKRKVEHQREDTMCKMDNSNVIRKTTLLQGRNTGLRIRWKYSSTPWKNNSHLTQTRGETQTSRKKST